MQARLVHLPAASLCIYTLHIILAFKILHPVIGKLFIPCTPVSLVLDRNWYQLLADFQSMLPWQRQWKAFRRKKNDIVSWNNLGAHFTNLPACILNLWSAWLCQWCFWPPLRADALGLWMFLSAGGCRRVFWSWALSFISVRGCLICSIVVLW